MAQLTVTEKWSSVTVLKSIMFLFDNDGHHSKRDNIMNLLLTMLLQTKSSTLRLLVNQQWIYEGNKIPSTVT